MIRRAAARAIAAALLVLAGAGFAAGPLVDATLPLLRTGFAVLAPEFALRSLTRGAHGADTSLVAEVSLARPVTIAGRHYTPDPRGTAWATTPAGHVLLLPAVVVLLVLAVPASGWREAAVRGGAAVSGLLPGMTLDTPAVLAANVWGLFPGAAARDGALGVWAAFMAGGGRIALGVLVGAAAIAAGRGVAARVDAAVSPPAAAAGRRPARRRSAGPPRPTAPRSANPGSPA